MWNVHTNFEDEKAVPYVKIQSLDVESGFVIPTPNPFREVKEVKLCEMSYSPNAYNQILLKVFAILG